MSLQLHNSYTFWLSRAASALQESFNQELSLLEVSWSQWMVINLVSRGLADTPATIAETIGVNRSAISRSLDRLEKKGLVVRVPDNEDRRSTKIQITGPGALMVAHMDDAAAQHQNRLLNQLDPDDRQSLKTLLSKLLFTQGIDCSSWN